MRGVDSTLKLLIHKGHKGILDSLRPLEKGIGVLRLRLLLLLFLCKGLTIQEEGSDKSYVVAF